MVVVDYTLPSAVNENAAFYCENGLPFVMGTTGGDRDRLIADVAASGNYAVIAPNMGKQIVAFQVGLGSAAGLGAARSTDGALCVGGPHPQQKQQSVNAATAGLWA